MFAIELFGMQNLSEIKKHHLKMFSNGVLHCGCF